MDRGPIDLLQRYSDILTNAFMALQYCPFQNTVPVALQTCLFMSKKILEALEALEKKEWTHEKIATTVKPLFFIIIFIINLPYKNAKRIWKIIRRRQATDSTQNQRQFNRLQCSGLRQSPKQC